MNIKATISTIALVAGLALTGPAFSQTILNGVEVAEDDLPAVQQRCDELLADDTQSLVSDDANEDDDNSADAGNGEPATEADTLNSQPEAAGTANTFTDVDLETITLEACVDAGLVTR
jgi:hypothetical protein